MLKRFLLCTLVLGFCLTLCACGSKVNPYKLNYTAGDGERVDYIYYEETFTVYVVGGMMTAEPEGKAVMLELALNEGRITVDRILEAAEADAANEKITKTEYPDGSVQYDYEGFTLVRLHTYTGQRDIYFLPSGRGYYDVAR